jgi:acetyl esterase
VKGLAASFPDRIGQSMALHPQVQALLKLVEDSGRPPLNELPPAEARVEAATLLELVGAGPDLPHVENFCLPTPAGSIAARRYVPDDPAATMLWIHGGGWVVCDLESHDAMCRLLAVESGCEVIAIDYRRAPEHPFPAALEDCWDALRRLAEQLPVGTAGQPSRRPLILGGDSAGGNLAAACALRARDRGGPDIALQVLVYPVTNCDLTTPSYVEHGSLPDTFLTSDEMKYFWHHYIPDVAARNNPEASPLQAADHCGLPQTVVVTAEYDPLRDDGLGYVEALRAAGVPVTHHHYDDVVHSFFSLPNLLERGNEAIAAVGADVRAAVARTAVTTSASAAP